MGFQNIMVTYKRKTAITPYYGVALYNATLDESLVLGLQFRGPAPNRKHPGFTLTDDENSAMYYAYPSSYGFASFIDVDSGFGGGWDGANGDPVNLPGPKIINVTINGQQIEFYAYKTDWPNLGTVTWKVT